MTRDTLPQNTLSRNVLPQNTEPQNIRYPEGTTGPDELDEPEVETASYSGRRPGRRWVRVLRRLLLTALACGLAVLLGFGVLLGVTPSVADARTRVDAQAAEHGARALSGALPSRVVAALIATEDSRFYSHQGIDPLGAIRGLSQPLFGGPDRGGASLDQQLVKLLYTGGRRDTIDQIEQTALAVKLDAHYSKDEILRMYLDTVYFGHGYYGIVAAAAGYFGQTPGTLTWTQASLLAGLVQAPSAYDPYEHLAAARARQRHVLDRLVATGRLTATQATQVLSAPLDLR
ncbi:biosynthetic peptidoglycan transglycosylase [Candidatus Frankia nodulisporulans]|uniref:biosynthetic peptidoglycan transglycosylase n=1 Tax=Candidatus Frankia nodulisporulans TaxID=2060052 RepID=UPI0013D2FEE4|nr:biosynthetic peptidoglycan transglycosylase [Candidatus Frankia nodulisporulans]